MVNYFPMKFLQSFIAFFTDDLPSAAMVILWSIVLAFASRTVLSAQTGSIIYLVGIVGILIYSTWNRSKKLSK
jgi:hypothetical protein